MLTTLFTSEQSLQTCDMQILTFIAIFLTWYILSILFVCKCKQVTLCRGKACQLQFTKVKVITKINRSRSIMGFIFSCCFYSAVCNSATAWMNHPLHWKYAKNSVVTNSIPLTSQESEWPSKSVSGAKLHINNFGHRLCCCAICAGREAGSINLVLLWIHFWHSKVITWPLNYTKSGSVLW